MLSSKLKRRPQNRPTFSFLPLIDFGGTFMSLVQAEIRPSTLGDLLLDAAEAWPDKDAVVVPEQKLSYAQLADNAKFKARSLLGMGVKPGEHVGLMMPNVVDTVEWLFAVAFSGAVAVMINARYKKYELAYVIHNADLRVLITTNCLDEHTNFLQILSDAIPGLEDSPGPTLELESAPLLRRVVVSGREPKAKLKGVIYDDQLESYAGAGEVNELSRRAEAVSLREPCMMLYTSGTTSAPKGCPLSHENIVCTAMAIAKRLRITERDKQWNPLPLFHLASVMPMLATFVRGGSYIFSAHFDAAAAWDIIQREKATILYPAFPTIMSDLLAHPSFDSLDLSSIRLINNVAPPQRLLENMRKIPGATHISAYGLTEASGLSCYSDLDDDDETRANVIGSPFPGVQIKIVEPETDRELEAGAKGEIVLKGFAVFSGYYGAEEKTAEVLNADGWFRTGDLGEVNSSRQLVFHGRIKDTLKVGGENVSALEVESYLSLHPHIKLAQVVGVPDDKLQEVVAAFVELNPGLACTEGEIIDYCRGSIASFKVPRYVRFVRDWPMSSTKVKKFELKQLLVEELASR